MITEAIVREAWRRTLLDIEAVDESREGQAFEFERLAQHINDLERKSRRTRVCLCGSTRFPAAFRAANLKETLAGEMIYTIGCEWHSDHALGFGEEVKEQLDELHMDKIADADEILVLNVGGYVGTSTRREIEHARKLGKLIRWLEEPGKGEDA